MTEEQQTRASKFLSLVLRHKPHVIGLTLDDAGCCAVDDLLQKLAQHERAMTVQDLQEVVRNNSKQRFTLSDDGTRIRANQGHSVEVDLQLQPQAPPELLYHGTVAQSLAAIRQDGLQRLARHHVHLSKDVETATAVGQRRGKPVILTVRAGEMHRAGMLFYQSENGVWLADAVPPAYLDFPQTHEHS